MMVRTTIMLPSGLRRRSTQRAHQRGLSFGQLVRELLAAELEHGSASADVDGDPLFADRAVFKGRAPKDVAKEYDACLCGAAKELEQSLAVPGKRRVNRRKPPVL
jgi:hypothetical protein